MKFFTIIANRTEDTYPTVVLLRKACEQHSIEFVPIYSQEFNFLDSVEPSDTDFFYRVGVDESSIKVEKHLLVHTQAKHFYHTFKDGLLKADNVYEASLLHQHLGLPIIPTVFDCPTDKNLLEKYVEMLGGFPIVIKATGGSHGVGVVKVDSFSALSSLADLLVSSSQSSGTQFILRKFIDIQSHARLIVLAGKVISSIEYHQPSKDFRTNVGESPLVSSKKFPTEIEEIAQQSVTGLGWDFGGVDILIDKEGRGWIAEVNLPCFFPRAQNETGDDVAGAMVGYAIHKTSQG